MAVVPSTTAISSETLSSVAMIRAFSLRFSRDWAAMVNERLTPMATVPGRRYVAAVAQHRDASADGLKPVPGMAPAEWRISDGRVPYDAALTAMDARVAAIAA